MTAVAVMVVDVAEVPVVQSVSVGLDWLEHVGLHWHGHVPGN